MGSSSLPAGVGFTAVVAAFSRARESARDDHLFTDPLAARFVQAANMSFGPKRDDGSSALWYTFFTIFAVRTPFYDDHLLRHIDAGSRQIVLLGAGLDARAYRLDLPPDTVVYELDTPSVLDFKASVLADVEPGVKRVPVAVDLLTDWTDTLKAGGFDPSAPTIWLAEGLLMYFGEAESDRLLADITSISAPGSAFVTEYLSRRTRMDDVPGMDPEEQAIAQVFVDNCKTGPAGEPSEWLPANGWRLDQQLDFAELLTSLGREVPVLFHPDKPDPVWYWLTAGSLGSFPRE